MEGIELAWVSGISGVIATFISSIFFYLYARSLRRLDEFHAHLREIQRIVSSLFLSGLIQQSAEADEERKQIISLLLSGLDRPRRHGTDSSRKEGTASLPSRVPAA
jgi:Cyanobacterial TRADD-N associated 2-Transmembrane domain